MSRSSSFPLINVKIIQRLVVLLYVIIQSYWYFMFLKRYQNNKNVYISKYEDLVVNPVHSIENICKFLEITYEKQMIDVTVRGSSYFEKFDGFNAESINKWKKELHFIEIKIINLILNHFLSRFDYK